MRPYVAIAVALSVLFLPSCGTNRVAEPEIPREPPVRLSPEYVAGMFSELPLEKCHLMEVHDAVNSSSDNGYDEEYTLKDLLLSPGSGVGDDRAGKATKAGMYDTPIRTLISDYLSKSSLCKSGGDNPEKMLKQLEDSGYQVYWPYSEDWDGSTFPIITFDPGYGAESNYGYLISVDADGSRQVDSVFVDENVAMTRPVWVINTNDDSAFTPLDLVMKSSPLHVSRPCGTAVNRKLMLKSFRMLRNYDSWFGGASEFFLKCGSVNGFTASTEAELKLYSPSVTDMMIVVKRKYCNKWRDYDSIILTGFTNQMDQLVFLITEDDGGTVTSWKCSAVVKINSKSYGFEVDIPYRDKDDIVWRGQLSASFFRSEDEVTGRFGDVEVTFALE